MVNQQVLDGNWTSIKGQIQETWGHLTDNDLQKVKGDAKQLVGLIQTKTGEAREQIEAKLEDLVARGSNIAAQAGEHVQAAYDQTAEQVRQGYRQAEEMVQQRPIESVAVAFGSGLIAGVIVGLVMRSR